MTKKSRQKLKYLENEKSFWSEIKSIFIIFKGRLIAKNCLRHKSAHLNKIFLKILQYSQENSVLEYLFYNVADRQAYNFTK